MLNHLSQLMGHQMGLTHPWWEWAQGSVVSESGGTKGEDTEHELCWAWAVAVVERCVKRFPLPQTLSQVTDTFSYSWVVSLTILTYTHGHPTAKQTDKTGQTSSSSSSNSGRCGNEGFLQLVFQVEVDGWLNNRIRAAGIVRAKATLTKNVASSTLH